VKAAAAPGQGKPTGLIGLSGAGRLFTEGVLRLMGELNEQPIIMPMSNPTHRMECTAEDAQRMTGAARQPRAVTNTACGRRQLQRPAGPTEQGSWQCMSLPPSPQQVQAWTACLVVM